MRTGGPMGDDIRSAIDRYERPLVAYALRFVRSPEQARDVVQETFLTLCDYPPGDLNGNLAGWLYTVCRNKSLDAQRKEGRMTQLDEMPPDTFVSDRPSPLMAVEQDESTRAILAQLDQLPESQQEVIRLKFQHGLSYRDIASVTKLSESNVGYLISTGLKAIRAALNPPVPRATRP